MGQKMTLAKWPLTLVSFDNAQRDELNPTSGSDQRRRNGDADGAGALTGRSRRRHVTPNRLKIIAPKHSAVLADHMATGCFVISPAGLRRPIWRHILAGRPGMTSLALTAPILV